MKQILKLFLFLWPSNTSFLQPDHAYIDLAFLRDFSNGSHRIYTEILSVSLSQTGEDADNLERALKEGDHATIRMICHKLRSSMSFIGVKQETIGRLAHVEGLGPGQDAEFRRHTPAIIDICTQVREELRLALSHSSE